MIAVVNRFQFFISTIGIFRTGQFFAEMRKAESVVDALIEDAAEFCITLDEKNGRTAVLCGTLGGC